MLEFTNMAAAAAFLETLDVEHTKHQLLKALGGLIAQRSREKIGILQPASGPYPAWAELAASTVARKGHDAPLYETGGFEETIDFKVNGSKSVTIGTPKEEAVFSELGTIHEPPRPVLQPAVYEVLNDEDVQEAMNGLVVNTLFEAAHISVRAPTWNVPGGYGRFGGPARGSKVGGAGHYLWGAVR